VTISLNGVQGSTVTTSVVITSRTRLFMDPPRSTPLPLDGFGWLSLARSPRAT
jgi:hypothetical protein